MKCAMLCSSATGNTKELKRVIEDALDCSSRVLDADLVFVGFWTDKGTCDERTLENISLMKDKKVFLFGTAGFGQSKDYFSGIIDKVIQQLNPSNEVVGWYMCQGKMPQSVRDRYLKMQQEQPDDKWQMLIDNFDEALSHPNEEDLNDLKEIIRSIK